MYYISFVFSYISYLYKPYSFFIFFYFNIFFYLKNIFIYYNKLCTIIFINLNDIQYFFYLFSTFFMHILSDDLITNSQNKFICKLC